MKFEDNRLQSIWDQSKVPVIFRFAGTGSRPIVRLPFALENRMWLQMLGRINPTWDRASHQWIIPKSWFNSFVRHALTKYKRLYVIQPFREQEKCAPACLNATGHECQCSCMGANHGAGNDGSWFEVSETFATRWSNAQIACRLMILK